MPSYLFPYYFNSFTYLPIIVLLLPISTKPCHHSFACIPILFIHITAFWLILLLCTTFLLHNSVFIPISFPRSPFWFPRYRLIAPFHFYSAQLKRKGGGEEGPDPRRRQGEGRKKRKKEKEFHMAFYITACLFNAIQHVYVLLATLFFLILWHCVPCSVALLYSYHVATIAFPVVFYPNFSLFCMFPHSMAVGLVGFVLFCGHLFHSMPLTVPLLPFSVCVELLFALVLLYHFDL